ncbi:MAG: hypothetical protein E7Y34_01785 [Mycoplasma sp.]|nr:hypothetical protein [Mycoplasma sp.]
MKNKILWIPILATPLLLSAPLVAYKTKNKDSKKSENKIINETNKKELDNHFKMLGETIASFIKETKIDLVNSTQEEVTQKYQEYIKNKLSIQNAGENKFEYRWYWTTYWRWYFTWDGLWSYLGMSHMSVNIVAKATTSQLAKMMLQYIVAKFGVTFAIPGVGKAIAAAGITFALSLAWTIIQHKLWEDPTRTNGIVVAFFLAVKVKSWKQ